MRTGASNYWGRVRQACTGIVIEASSFQGTVNTALIDNQAGGRKHRFSNNFVNGNAVFGGTRRAEGFDEDNFCKRTIADDAAIILTPPTVGGVLVTTFEFYSTRRPGHAGKSYVDAQGAVANIFSLYSSGSVTFTTGILSGTTGVDGDLTVAAHTDGKVYVENRSGTPITFVYKFAGTSDE